MKVIKHKKWLRRPVLLMALAILMTPGGWANILLTDTEPPVITCPADMYISGSGAQVVDYELPVVTDNSGVVIVPELVSGLPPGSVFPVGITTNVWMAADTSGNQSFCSFTVTLVLNDVTGLEGDGTASPLMTPQGSHKYQRMFYLIRPDEITGIESGQILNSIGFTIVRAQNSTTQGLLKVYLENTTDTESRMDTDWTYVPVTGTSVELTELTGGDYEWQVGSDFPDTPTVWSDQQQFSTSVADTCNQPYNLKSLVVTPTSTRVMWEAASSNGFQHFRLDYKLLAGTTWTSMDVEDTFVLLEGLASGETYLWKVTSVCDVNSQVSLSTFTTGKADQCDEPWNLTVGMVTDDSVNVTWLGVPEARYYNILFRRKGTEAWSRDMSQSTNATIRNLMPGTSYEWGVMTGCDDNATGDTVMGPGFTTSGALQVYAPANPGVSNINPAGATLKWNEADRVNVYMVRYRLMEHISWENAVEPMTVVSDDTLTIPDITGELNIAFVNGEEFTYNGNGLYVALEYSNPDGPYSNFNYALCTHKNTSVKDTNGVETAKIVMGFNGRTSAAATEFPEVLRSVRLRPETRFGIQSQTDILEVTGLYTPGYIALPYTNTIPVEALVRNYSSENQITQVHLNVYDRLTGTGRYSESREVDIPPGSQTMVSFTGWLPTETGVDSLLLSIPAATDETIIANNSRSVIQHVNMSVSSYADDSPVISSAGLGSEGGMLLSRMRTDGCAKVPRAMIYLTPGAVGKLLKAVILDENGLILDTSPEVLIDSAMVQSYYPFYFEGTPQLKDQYYYAGLIQAPSTEPYSPVGIQWEGSYVRANSFFSADYDGSNLEESRWLGRLMIKTELVPSMMVPYISGNDVFCEGGNNQLVAAGRSVRYAAKVISATSGIVSATRLLGYPDSYPEYKSNTLNWVNDKAADSTYRDELVLEFTEPGPVNYIDIYETLNPGVVEKVSVSDGSGAFTEVYSGDAIVFNGQARINHLNFDLTGTVKQVKITLHTGKYGNYHAIDAVAIGVQNDPAIFDSYLWEPGGSTGQSVTATSAQEYTLTVTSTSGCSATASIILTEADLEAPVISANGPVEICEGDTLILTSNKPDNNLWNTGGDNTGNSIAVTTSGTYSVSWSNGCTVINSNSITVVVNPLPEPVISGGPMCEDIPAVLRSENAYAAYAWSTDPVQTTREITVGEPGEYFLTVTDNNGCSGTAGVVAFMAPTPSPVIYGNTMFCPGASTVLEASEGFSSYSWSTGAITRVIDVYGPATEPFELSVTVTNEYGCPGTEEVWVSEYPAPEPFISGTLSLCSGSSTLLDAGGGYRSYLWSTNETTRNIVVDTIGTFTVDIIDANGCAGSASATTDFEGAMPPTPGQITGPQTGMCGQTGIEYSIQPVSNTVDYLWTVPEGVVLVSGQGTTSIIVNSTSPVNGRLIVASTNICGQSPTWGERFILVDGTPAMPGIISGPTAGVCGLSGVVYSVPPVFGADTYTWTVPTGVVISGNGSPTVMLSFGSSFTSGQVCVTASNSCGTGAQRCITITGPPQTPATIYGPTAVCPKAKNVVYSVDPVAYAGSYQWTVPMQAAIISGQGTSSIVVNFGIKPGNITVQALNGCGASQMSQLAVIIDDCREMNPFVYTIYPNNTYNINNPEWNYAWGQQVFVPEVISSAGGYTYSAHSTVSWTIGEPVIQTISNDSYMLSQGFHQELSGIMLSNTNPDATFTVEVFPVPTKGLLNIRVVSEYHNPDLIIRLYDMMGNLVFTDHAGTQVYNHQLHLNHYATGLMILKVSDPASHAETSVKIVKVK